MKAADASAHVFHPNWTFIAGIACIGLGLWIAMAYSAEAYLKSITAGSEYARGLTTKRYMEENIRNKKNQEEDLRSLLLRATDLKSKKDIDLYIKQYGASQEFRRMVIAGSNDLAQVRLINERNRATLLYHFWLYRMSAILAASLALAGTICISRAFIALRFPQQKHKASHHTA